MSGEVAKKEGEIGDQPKNSEKQRSGGLMGFCLSLSHICQLEPF